MWEVLLSMCSNMSRNPSCQDRKSRNFLKEPHGTPTHVLGVATRHSTDSIETVEAVDPIRHVRTQPWKQMRLETVVNIFSQISGIRSSIPNTNFRMTSSGSLQVEGGLCLKTSTVWIWAGEKLSCLLNEVVWQAECRSRSLCPQVAPVTDASVNEWD